MFIGFSFMFIGFFTILSSLIFIAGDVGPSYFLMWAGVCFIGVASVIAGYQWCLFKHRW
jgi:hypothetical protein